MHLQCEFYSSAPEKELFIREFLNYPQELFADDSSVKKLPFEIEAMYFKIHPFKHDFFLLKEKGRIVLRSMVCQTPHNGIMYFGLFDFDFRHKEAETILGEFKKIVADWARSSGARTVLGPINFSTWLSYRLMSFNDGGERFSFEPDRPVVYCDLLKKNGFVTNQLFSSKGYDQLENIINLSRPDYDRALAGGYVFQWTGKELTESDLSDLHRLSVSIFKDNYLATPIDFTTFKTLYAAQSGKDDYSHSFFILSPEGERIGFFINFVEHGHVVIKTIGIDRAHRGTGISNGGMYLALTKVAEKGIHKMVAAMVKEGAQSESYGRKMHLLWTHLYEILELPL